jgi:type IV pilus assembly protein PilV
MSDHAVRGLRRPLSAPRGFALLEAMVALVLFAIGILGLLAAQSGAVKDASSAQYRSTAAALAEDLIDRMWLSDRTAATLQASFGSSGTGAGYTSWKTHVTASGLPGVSAHPPEVSFTTVAGGGTATASSLATVKVHWLAPGETTAHTYTALAQIK